MTTLKNHFLKQGIIIPNNRLILNFVSLRKEKDPNGGQERYFSILAYNTEKKELQDITTDVNSLINSDLYHQKTGTFKLVGTGMDMAFYLNHKLQYQLKQVGFEVGDDYFHCIPKENKKNNFIHVADRIERYFLNEEKTQIINQKLAEKDSIFTRLANLVKDPINGSLGLEILYRDIQDNPLSSLVQDITNTKYEETLIAYKYELNDLQRLRNNLDLAFKNGCELFSDVLSIYILEDLENFANELNIKI